MHAAVRALLELLADRVPLVLALDDLHWADSGSLELLGTLLRRPPSAPVLIVAAMRPRQVPPLLAATLERTRRGGALTRVELSPLSEAEARALLGDGVDSGAAGRLYADSGGNPFYLEQLARSARRPGAAGGSAGAEGALDALDVPPAVAASLAEELALLTPATGLTLAGAAVAGDPFEPELAAAAAGVSDAEAIAALDELLERDLVRPTDVPRRFRFRHPLVRGAVYSTAPGGWRLGAHERSAAALAERGAPAAARAHHVEYAGRHGDAAAIGLLSEAGREVLYRTPAGAARWFACALRLLPAGAPAGQRVELLLASAGALAATGRFEEARDAVLEGLALSPPDAVAQRLELISACAWLDTLKGEHARAQARLEAATALEDCGAMRYRDAAERELRRLGSRRAHRRTRRGRSDGTPVESLTERELQVARLIVDRHTNPQIAAELFLSLKTVESHVRNLFHKLGVSSRVEVARVVERADVAALR